MMYRAAVYIFLILLSVTNGFNLAPKYGIVFDNPGGELNKNYFGFTVGLQRQRVGFGVTSR